MCRCACTVTSLNLQDLLKVFYGYRNISDPSLQTFGDAKIENKEPGGARNIMKQLKPQEHLKDPRFECHC